MKLSTAITCCLSTLFFAGVAKAEPQQSLRVSDKRMKELEDFVEKQMNKEDQSIVELDLTDLDITDEREAGPLCNLFTRSIQGFLEDNVPFSFDCTCRIRFFRRKVEYNCATNFCVRDFKEILPIDTSQPLPIADGTCFYPSVGGSSNFRGEANSKVCTGETDIVVNLTQIEALTGLEFNKTEETFQVPNTCLSVSHNFDSLTTFKSCSVTIFGEDCACEVCDDGNGVQLDCVELIDEQVPEILDPVLNYTVQCVYPGVFDGESTSTAGIGLLAPFLTMNV